MKDFQTTTTAIFAVLILIIGGNIISLDDRTDDNEKIMNQKFAQSDDQISTLNIQVNQIMNGPDWINEQGNGDNLWSLSLNSSQWLEVKSTVFWFSYDYTNEVYMQPMMIKSEFGPMLEEGGYSQIFGGTYEACVFFAEGVCYATNPESTDFQMNKWSIIYRIHES